MKYIEYELFHKLYDCAKECGDVDNFIEEQMEELYRLEIDDKALLLRFIHKLSGMGIKDIREYLGMLRPQFCKTYDIKLRTLEDWEYEKNKIPERLLKLLSYTLVIDFLN